MTVDYDVQEALKQEGLKLQDYEEICKRLKRKPNRAELGMFGVMWSEHCCYRNSRTLLGNFPTKGPRILVGPGENAGVVDLGQGDKLAFKIESHNHPSALEPFQGAATGVGGILRDIFTMGARPIALLNALRFGPLETPKNVGLMQGVVAGISHYGNCVGVPTIGGEVGFDDSYSGNPLVNAMAIGLMETDNIVCSGAKGIGFPVLYVGSTTGRDGMGGASFASAELSKSSSDDRPAVQVGDPFLEKGLIEACLSVFKTGDVIAAQDMGAAGLTCSCSEMAAKGDLGIELDLDKVPAREHGMTPYEFLLSESQERMLFVISPGSEKRLIQEFTRWGLHGTVVGRVLEEKTVRILQNGQIVADIPANALANDTPVEQHDLLPNVPLEISNHWLWSEQELPECDNFEISIFKNDVKISTYTWNQILLKLLDDPTIASKRWVYRQYDYQVQSNTIIPPGQADAAVIRLRGQQSNTKKNNHTRGVAAVVDCSNRWVYLDPERGAVASVVESARNLSCVGAEPLAVTDNLNFPSPETPLGYWQLAMACKGITYACTNLETPVTGGNVSLYNETRNQAGKIKPIQPTPVIGMVGLVHNIDSIVGQGWLSKGDTIWLLGVPLSENYSIDSRVTLSASMYLQNIHGLLTGRPPEIDLTLEKSIQSFLRDMISKKYINSAHDVSDGGLSVALAECCISSSFGCHVKLPPYNCRIDRILYAEGGSRILVSVPENSLLSWTQALEDLNGLLDKRIPAQEIGVVTHESKLLISQGETTLIDLSLKDLSETYEMAIPRRMGLDKFP